MLQSGRLPFPLRALWADSTCKHLALMNGRACQSGQRVPEQAIIKKHWARDGWAAIGHLRLASGVHRLAGDSILHDFRIRNVTRGYENIFAGCKRWETSGVLVARSHSSILVYGRAHQLFTVSCDIIIVKKKLVTH